MRIIAGSLKGRRLKSPTWDGLRPTSDKLRGTLFNILAPRIAGARVLDGYAGTGASGLEAISRGAAGVTFVERDPRAQALIGESVAHCGVENACVIIRASMARALAMLRAAGSTFDIVLLDPPYADSMDVELHDVAPLVAPGGVVVVEHAKRTALPEHVGPLARSRVVRSGDSVLTFYSLAGV
jgi:16S rRNA (guanine(966)-N(2))-methyltransferase RsmD